jgi:(2Fe-2S) ferredoxin
VPAYEHHIFVCENLRPAEHPRGSCGAKGSTAVRARLKELVREHGLAGRVRANAAGCLDCCETGPTVVVYPEGVWYRGVGIAEAEEIFARHVLGGEVVERLRLPTARSDATAGPDVEKT